MRWNVRDFAHLISVSFKIERPLIEFGAREAEGQTPGFGDLRGIFGQPYIGVDYQKGVGVDLVDDIMDSKIESNSVKTVFAFDTFEHIANPFKAMNTVYRILNSKSGLFVMSVPFRFPIHNYPFDYWRYTPQAVEVLLAGFKKFLVFSEGDPLDPHTVFGIGSMNPNCDFGTFLDLYNRLEKQREETAKERGLVDTFAIERMVNGPKSSN